MPRGSQENKVNAEEVVIKEEQIAPKQVEEEKQANLGIRQPTVDDLFTAEKFSDKIMCIDKPQKEKRFDSIEQINEKKVDGTKTERETDK